jgi:hypothetical protein
MVRLLARDKHPDLARLQAPAAPDGAFVGGQDGGATKAVGRWGALDVNHSVDGGPEDLDSPELQELELALERPAAELSEAMFPTEERFSHFVEVAGSQR